MSEYSAPTADMLFVLEHLAGLSQLANREGYEHADLETVAGVLEEAAVSYTHLTLPTTPYV